MGAKVNVNTWRIFKTCLVCLSFLTMGYLMSILGPTLLDLQHVVGATLQQTAYVVPVRALCYACGSLLGGMILKVSKLHFYLAVTLTVASISLGLLPWCHSIAILMTTVAISGFFMGGLDVYVTLYLFELWHERAATFIQIGYFFYGLGAFTAPLAAAPFLLPFSHNHTNGAHNTSTPVHESHNTNATSIHVIKNNTFIPIMYPYAFLAVFGTCLATIVILVGQLARKVEKEAKKNEEKKEEEKKVSALAFYSVVVIAAIIMHLYFGTVTAVGTMLEAYLVEGEAKLSPTIAAYLTSAFWAGYAFFRLATTVLSEMMGPGTTTFVEMIVIVISNGMLILFRQHYIMLWVAVILLGIGFSSIFGLILAYVQQYITISPRVLSLFLAMSCLGEFVYPTLVVSFVETNPNVFIWIIVGCSAVLCSMTAVLSLVCRNIKHN